MPVGPEEVRTLNGLNEGFCGDSVRVLRIK